MSDRPTTYGLLEELKTEVKDGFVKVDKRLKTLEEDGIKRRAKESLVRRAVMFVVAILSAAFGAKYGGKI